jgi:predicted ATPase
VLYQNALYASLRPTRKASLSSAVAEALLGYYGKRRSAIAAELAMLFEAARDFERAAEYFALASEQAMPVSAYKEAIALARRGLDALTLLPDRRERAQQELRLQTILGPALMATVGFGAPEVEAVYNRSRELCQRIGEAPEIFPVVWGLWQHWLSRGNYQSALELANQLVAMAQKAEDSALLLMAEHSFGNTLWLIGDFEAAQAAAERHNALYVPERHHALASRFGGYDTGVAGLCGAAVQLWPLGYADRARQSGRDAIVLARKLSHSYSLAFAFTFDAMVQQYCRDVERTRQEAEEALALATELELAPWLAWAGTLRGWALVEQGEVEEGLAQLSQAIGGWKAGGLGCITPYFLALLAEAYAKTRQPEAARDALAEALAITKQTHEGFAEAELHRLNGELQRDAAAAEVCFRQAVEIARRQNAKSLELRAVMSLSRLHEKQGKQAAAHQMLSKIYGWFTEGFDTADLKDAAALLNSLTE